MLLALGHDGDRLAGLAVDQISALRRQAGRHDVRPGENVLDCTLVTSLLLHHERVGMQHAKHGENRFALKLHEFDLIIDRVEVDVRNTLRLDGKNFCLLRPDFFDVGLEPRVRLDNLLPDAFGLRSLNRLRVHRRVLKFPV